MAFVDEVTIRARAGNGGNGVIRWLRSQGKAYGGPGGGDGGRGGDVVLQGVRDLSALGFYRFEKEFRAQDGGAGESELRHGAHGAGIVLTVPVGTVARVAATERTYEILNEGDQVTVLHGGEGGKGNARFKGSTNQNPFQQTNGKPGESGEITLTLKIIANAGLIGMPNAGKSTLLNALTHAKAKVGNYAFTTLEPNLGDFNGYLIADIPGLIEGASQGKGLGTRFLKHAERTGIIVHLISVEQDSPEIAYEKVMNELVQFGHGLSDKTELVVLSKVDLVPEEVWKKTLERLSAVAGRQVVPLSSEVPELRDAFAQTLLDFLSKGPAGL